MEIAEVKKLVAEFEDIMQRAYEQKYAAYPASFKESMSRMNVVRRWDLNQFVEAYVTSGQYPPDRLDRAIHHLFDVKLQLYYILEVDLGLSNSIVYDRGYDAANPLVNPHLLMARFSLDQNLIGKSRVLWERIMNFVYYLETGETLEGKVSGKRSKRKVFFEFLDGAPRWRWLEPYGRALQAYEDKFRTPEFHKSSVLRAELFGKRTNDPQELLDLVNRAMNGIFENVIAIVSGKKPYRFTDLHDDADGNFVERYSGGDAENQEN